MQLTQSQPATPPVAPVPEPEATKPEASESEAPKPEAPEPAVTKKGQKAVRPLDGGIMPAKINVPENVSPATPKPSAAVEPQRGNICGRTFEFFRQDGRPNISGENGITLAIRLAKKTCTSADLNVTPDAKKPKRFTVEEWNLVVDLTHSAVAVLEFVDEQPDLQFKLD